MQFIAPWLAAGSLGAMLYFSFAIAPMVFRVLPAEEAGRFLRAQFPVYFTLNGLVALLAAVLAYDPVASPLFVTIGTAMLGVRVVAIPAVNAARDAMLAGEPAAKARFDRWHRLTVVVNFLAIVGLLAALALMVGDDT